MVWRGRRKSSRSSGRVLEKWTTEVDGIVVQVTRKDIKRMTLRIDEKDLAAKVSAPARASRTEIESFVRSKRSWIEAQQRRIAASPRYRAANATKAELREYRDLVSACVPALVEAWEPIMGVKAGELTYRSMKSRWGSCQPSTGRICINTRLALYPPECLEYVVVHELNHLRHPDHSAAFHADMDRFMPDWRARKKKLEL